MSTETREMTELEREKFKVRHLEKGLEKVITYAIKNDDARLLNYVGGVLMSLKKLPK